MYKSGNNMVLLAAIACFAALIATSDAIRCYTCSSDINTFCSDPFNVSSPQVRFQNYYKDCDAPSVPSFSYNQGKRNVCQKIRQKVSGTEQVIRTCTSIPLGESVGSCYDHSTASHINIEFCETCDHDGCNGASGVSATLMTLLAPLFPYFVLRK